MQCKNVIETTTIGVLQSSEEKLFREREEERLKLVQTCEPSYVSDQLIEKLELGIDKFVRTIVAIFDPERLAIEFHQARDGKNYTAFSTK